MKRVRLWWWTWLTRLISRTENLIAAFGERLDTRRCRAYEAVHPPTEAWLRSRATLASVAKMLFPATAPESLAAQSRFWLRNIQRKP